MKKPAEIKEQEATIRTNQDAQAKDQNQEKIATGSSTEEKDRAGRSKTVIASAQE
jgi:hypothetical protein